MHRESLLRQLQRYEPVDASEAASRDRMIDFVIRHVDCFERTLSDGHITGSAWLLDAPGARVLLTFHRKLNRWLQLGGHADGEPDVLSVALREAREESGIDAIEPVSQAIFDVDVHEIPAREGEPAHHHYDVRFLLRAFGSEPFRVGDESLMLRWFRSDELSVIDTDESVRRMARKWENLREAGAFRSVRHKHESSGGIRF